MLQQQKDSPTTSWPEPSPALDLEKSKTSAEAQIRAEASISKNMPRVVLDLKRRLDELQARDRTSVDNLQGELAKLTSMASQFALSISKQTNPALPASSPLRVTGTAPVASKLFDTMPTSSFGCSKVFGKQSSAAASSPTTSGSSRFGASGSTYAAPQVFGETPTSSLWQGTHGSVPDCCSGRHNLSLSACVSNFSEQNFGEMAQQYDFHNLSRKTVLLSDGSEHSYFALPENYPLEQATAEPVFDVYADETNGYSAEFVDLLAGMHEQQTYEADRRETEQPTKCFGKPTLDHERPRDVVVSLTKQTKPDNEQIVVCANKASDHVCSEDATDFTSVLVPCSIVGVSIECRARNLKMKPRSLPESALCCTHGKPQRVHNQQWNMWMSEPGRKEWDPGILSLLNMLLGKTASPYQVHSGKSCLVTKVVQVKVDSGKPIISPERPTDGIFSFTIEKKSENELLAVCFNNTSDNAFSDTDFPFPHGPVTHAARSIELTKENSTQVASVLFVQGATVHFTDEISEINIKKQVVHGTQATTPNYCDGHQTPIQSTSVPARKNNLIEHNVDGMLQAYGLHNLNCRTMVRADSTEQNYYALPENYPLERAMPEPLFSDESVGVFASNPGQQPYEEEHQEGDRLPKCFSMPIFIPERPTAGIDIEQLLNCSCKASECRTWDEESQGNENLLWEKSVCQTATGHSVPFFPWDPGASTYLVTPLTNDNSNYFPSHDNAHQFMLEKPPAKPPDRFGIADSSLQVILLEVQNSEKSSAHTHFNFLCRNSKQFSVVQAIQDICVLLEAIPSWKRSVFSLVHSSETPIKLLIFIEQPIDLKHFMDQFLLQCHSCCHTQNAFPKVQNCCLPIFLACPYFKPVHQLVCYSRMFSSTRAIISVLCMSTDTTLCMILVLSSGKIAQERKDEAAVYKVLILQLPMRQISHVWDPGIESISVFYKWLHIQIIHLVHYSAQLAPTQITAYCPSNVGFVHQQGVKKSYNAKNLSSSPNYLQILILDILFITFLPP